MADKERYSMNKLSPIADKTIFFFSCTTSHFAGEILISTLVWTTNAVADELFERVWPFCGVCG